MPPRNKIEVMSEDAQRIVRIAIFNAGFRRYAEVAATLKQDGIDVDIGSLDRYAKKNFKRKTMVEIHDGDGRITKIATFSTASEIAAAIKSLDESKI
jgi:hypothetical protein